MRCAFCTGVKVCCPSGCAHLRRYVSLAQSSTAFSHNPPHPVSLLAPTWDIHLAGLASETRCLHRRVPLHQVGLASGSRIRPWHGMSRAGPAASSNTCSLGTDMPPQHLPIAPHARETCCTCMVCPHIHVTNMPSLVPMRLVGADGIGGWPGGTCTSATHAHARGPSP